ncbi:MAG: zinc ABC transporter substrate-binding protein [Burkholderiaceae bacterium]|nr:zinc ABC transporter substrate-binding protein [Burkholderiaceae bacterium]
MQAKNSTVRRHVLRGVVTGVLSASVLASSVALAANAAAADTKPKVIASFSILADMAQQVAGPDAVVDVLVDRNSDAHGFEPTPRDARKLGAADVLIVNGLGFESWLPRLQQASGFKGTVVTASAGVKAREFGEGDQAGHDHKHADDHKHDHDHKHDDGHQHAHASDHKHDGGHSHDHSHAGHDHGPQDPHAWQSLENGRTYVLNIARALAKADPAHADGYDKRAKAYLAQIDQLDARLKRDFAALPVERRKVVSSHDAFGYFGQSYGVTFLPVSGLSTSAEPSASGLARLIEQVKREKVSALFIENVSSPRVVEQIARETQAKVGGTLYSDALSKEGQASTYLGMFEWNATQLLNALR